MRSHAERLTAADATAGFVGHDDADAVRRLLLCAMDWPYPLLRDLARTAYRLWGLRRTSYAWRPSASTTRVDRCAMAPGTCSSAGLITTGCLHHPEATAAVIQEGWLRTGDIARIDRDGYIWLLGRAPTTPPPAC